MKYIFTLGYRKCLAALVLMVALFADVKAQNEPIIAQYMYHTNVFNPAVPGNTRDIYVSALARQQWIGFKEAPSTQLLDVYGYVPKMKGGIGFVFTNDMLGKQRHTTAKVSYAYSQRMADRAFVSIGLSVGFSNRALKGHELVYQDVIKDPNGIYEQQNKFAPYIGLGIEFSVYGLRFGGAVSTIEQGLKKATVFKVPRHYFAYAKYDWVINEKATFSPAVFVRSIDFTTQAEINLSATIKKRVTLGVLYRTTHAAGALLGVYITKKILLSYSYDFDFGTLRSYQSGSHELNLGFRFGGAKEKKTFYGSPRYAN